MKMMKYQKRCFDQIEGIVAENKALSAEVDQLRSEAEEKTAEMVLWKSACSISIGGWPTRIGKGEVSHVF